MQTPAGRLRIDVLGPLRVCDHGGRDQTPSGELQRRLLALLVLRRGRVVSVDSEVDALWPSKLPDDPTAGPRHADLRSAPDRHGHPPGVHHLGGRHDGGVDKTAAGYHVCLDQFVELLDTEEPRPFIDRCPSAYEEIYAGLVGA